MSEHEPDLFYLNVPEFQAATKQLSPAEVWMLMALLYHRHMNGSLPDDPEQLRRLVGRVGKARWQRSWPAIREFLRPGGTPWFRTPEEMGEQEDDL